MDLLRHAVPTLMLAALWGSSVQAQAIFDAVARNDTAAVRALIAADATLPGARNSYQRTPLLIAARETGNLAVARMLLDAGADVNAQDRFGSTPLELAAWRGFEPVVNLLLDRGATLPTDRRRALYVRFAIEKGMTRLFQVTGGAAVDTSQRSESGGSLLHAAAAGGSPEIIAAMADRGLDVNGRDTYGRTPLHYAAEHGHAAAVRMLLARGARHDVRSLAGVSPLNAAEQYGGHDAARVLVEAGASREPARFPDLRGPWLGQAPPGRRAALFAADIVSTHTFQHGTVVFSPAGDEAYWSTSEPELDAGYPVGMIVTARRVDGRWTPPVIAPFSRPGVGDDVPFFHPDGSKLFFVSARDRTGEHFWWVERTPAGWSEPRRIEGGPNTLRTHWSFSVTANGSLYFSSGDSGGMGQGDIWVSRFVGGAWQPPVNLGAPVNSAGAESMPFVAPDESYVLFTRMMPEEHGWIDIFVSFHNADGTWTTPVSLGPLVNSPAAEICPTVTADGRWLFFNSSRNLNDDNYWIDASVIEDARRQP